MTTRTSATTTSAAARTGYAPVNGLHMYYEIHGAGRPVVLLHGALSAIGTSFGALLPTLAATHQVIGMDFQAHGRTADIDRPLSVPQLADDAAALMQHLGIGQADVIGYSLGAGVAAELARRYPDLVRKLVVISIAYSKAGFHPGLLEGIDQLQPEMLVGSPWHDEYLSIAPDPAAFPSLLEKIKEFERNFSDWPAEYVGSIQAPTLTIIGDSDIVRPEHAVESFRMLGGGVAGNNAGLPKAQLAILPGTTHESIVSRADLLLPIITPFLAAAD